MANKFLNGIAVTGDGTVTGKLSADNLELTSGSHHLTITESSSDWSILNAGQSNGIVIFDGTGGIDFLYNNNIKTTIDTSGLKVFGTSRATGLIVTPLNIIAGEGGGGVALTVNDGYGNANVTFNHVSGTPEQNGNSFRIETNTDSSTSAAMTFEIAEGVSSGVAVQTTEVFRLQPSGPRARAFGGGVLYLERDDTSIVAGNPLGRIRFSGDDPVNGTFNYGAEIRANAAGTWATDNYPTELHFYTKFDDTDLLALRLDKNQNTHLSGSLNFSSGGNIYNSTGTFIIQNNAGAQFDVKSNQGVRLYIDANGDDTTHKFEILSNTDTYASGNVVASVDQSGNATFAGQVTIPETPTADAHAASKKYVDDQVPTGVDVAKRIEISVKNISGGQLIKGTVVHAAPSASPPSGNVVEVIAADYDAEANMPAIGILNETLADDAEGVAVMMGAVYGIDTDGFTTGDELYVGADGALTNTKPQTAGQLIQKIAVCVKSHASNGLIKVFGAGRSNDVPLPLYIDNANQRLGINKTNPSEALDVNGNIAVTGTVDGVDISALPTSFAPTDAEANVQADWNETTTTSDAFILNKPTIPTDHGDHDGLYLPIGGGDLTGDLEIKKTDPKLTFYDNSGANGTPNGEIVFAELDGYENFKVRYNGTNDRFEYWGLISSTSTLLGYWNRSTGTSLHSVGSISTGSDGNSSNWKTAYDHSQAAHAPSDAEANVQADWTETTTTSDAFILNKPSTFPPSTHNHDGRYLRTHSRYSDDLDTITTSGVYIWDVSEADDEPTGASDGLLTIKYWDSSFWATASFQDFHNRTLHIKSKKNGTWQTDWAQVWTTDQLTTTNKSNYDTAYSHSQVAHAPSDAEANVQADWNATSGDAYILNKPTIPTDHGDHDGLYLEKIYKNNWTRVGYGNSGGVRYHKLATITVTSSYIDYNATFDWTGRYASGTAGIHVHSDGDTTADIYGAWYEDFNPSYTLESTNGWIKYTVSGSVVEIWVKTSGWREFDYIIKDSVTEGSPTVTWYDETTTTDQATAPSNLNVFTNRTHTAAGYSTATGVADNAEVNVQADWNATSGDALILNKPTIPTDHGDHDGLYIPVGGGTITSGTSVGLTINHNTFEQGLVLHRNHASNAASIVFKNNGGVNGTLFAIASDGAPYWQYNDSASPNYRIHTANDFTVADVTGALPKAGGTMTGTLVMSAVNPEIHFNGTSDTGVDMAIKATPEGLNFYEPEDSNKIHFQILDDTGVNAVYGYKLNGTMVISSSRVLANVTGNISMFTNDSGYLTRTTPNAPTNLTTTIVNSTINVTFTASTTTNIDYYLVFSSVDGGDYGLISVIPPADFGATMSIIDDSFDATGTQAYRVYAVKNGVYSSALTGSKDYDVTSAEPTNMSVVNLNSAYYVQWDPPSANARFVSAYNVYKHEHATQSSLDRDSATLIYSGLNTSYMYQISGANNGNYHQFWVETTVA